MAEMKIASLWRLNGSELELKPELGRCEDAAEKQRLLEFLRGGGIALRSPGLREDRLDPARAAAVPLGYLSDGEWVWPLELSYYLERHDLLPQEEFLRHIRERGFVAAVPAPEVLAAAARLLTGDAP
jgi:hypothetical protein